MSRTVFLPILIENKVFLEKVGNEKKKKFIKLVVGTLKKITKIDSDCFYAWIIS